MSVELFSPEEQADTDVAVVVEVDGVATELLFCDGDLMVLA